MSYLGHPIVGDILYGGEPIGQRELDHPPFAAGSRRYLTFARDKNEGQRIADLAQKRDDLILARPALHAALLRLTHPNSKQPVSFTAPLHATMKNLVTALRQRTIDGPVATEGTWVDLCQAVPDK